MDEREVERFRQAIADGSPGRVREMANGLLDELISRERAAAMDNPVTVWDSAVGALRRLACQPAAFGRERTDMAALERAADWLASIGPRGGKSPCEVCLKPTSISCSRCDRSLCQIHAARNTKTGTHDGGSLRCD